MEDFTIRLERLEAELAQVLLSEDECNEDEVTAMLYQRESDIRYEIEMIMRASGEEIWGC